METVWLTIENILSLFLMMLAGFFLAKAGRLSLQTREQMSWILVNVVMPCLILTSMSAIPLAGAARVFLQTAGIMFSVMALTAAGVQLLFRRQPEDTRAVLRYGMVYSNFAFIGMPILQAAFGSGAVIYATITLASAQIITWTHGIALMDPRNRGFSCKAFFNAGTVSFFIGYCLMLLQIQLPAPVEGALGFLGGMNTPVAMLLVGAQMADADLLSIFRRKIVYQVSLVRLLVVPAAAIAALYPLHLDPVMYTSLIILIGCPCGNATAVFAQMFRRDVVTAAQIVIQSTLLFPITLPLLMLAAQYLAAH